MQSVKFKIRIESLQSLAYILRGVASYYTHCGIMVYKPSRITKHLEVEGDWERLGKEGVGAGGTRGSVQIKEARKNREQCVFSPTRCR